MEQVAGLPLLRVVVDQLEIARYGLTAEEVLTLSPIGPGRERLSDGMQGSWRFELVVIGGPGPRDPGSLGSLLIPTTAWRTGSAFRA